MKGLMETTYGGFKNDHLPEMRMLFAPEFAPCLRKPREVVILRQIASIIQMLTGNPR